MVRASLNGALARTNQLLAGLFADAGVTFALLQLDLPDAQLAAVQPDKGAADPADRPGRPWLPAR